jgi:replicative DNA helicase
MQERQLIKLLLKKKFYDNNKSKVSKTTFTNGLGNVFTTIQKAHEEYQQDLSIDELIDLHLEKYNPALTRAARVNFESMVDEIRKEQEPSEDVAADILTAVHKRNLAHKVAVVATDIFNGHDRSFNDIKDLLEGTQTETQEEEAVTDDIGELMDSLDIQTKFEFNLPSLHEQVPGIGAGNLVILFARPESGKTAFWVNLVGGIQGFASQGAKVHALINEEPAVRTQMRVINAHTGMTKDEIVDNMDVAKDKWKDIKDNVKLMDTVDWTIDDVNNHCEQHKPDILIIDQLDKVNVVGNFSRTDEKLRAVYTGAREIAKRHDCCVIAISQASADAHGKTSISFDMMENSKTGKAAEADLIIGIGKHGSLDSLDTTRVLCISKNKISGYHGEITCNIEPQLSRYRV